VLALIYEKGREVQRTVRGPRVSIHVHRGSSCAGPCYSGQKSMVVYVLNKSRNNKINNYRGNTNNTHALTSWSKLILLITCTMITLLLFACQPARVSVSQPTAQPPAQSEATALPELPPAVEPTAEAVQPTESASADLLLDISGLAKDQTIE